MRWLARVVATVCVSSAFGLMAQSAQAQPARTWISGVGDDANPCSRTAPCKTFAGAISKTAAGGEIDVLDPGGFGSVTITKAITLFSDGAVGGILTAGVNGIVVNAGPTDTVVIHGLDLEGFSSTTPSLNGIKFIAGGSLRIEDSNIRGFTGASPNGWGVQFVPTTSSELYIVNTTITHNGAGGNGGGVLIKPSGGCANVLIQGSHIDNNQAGVTADGSGSGCSQYVDFSDSTISGNSANGFTATTVAGQGRLIATVSQATISTNSGVGINANGAAVSGPGSSTVRVGGSNISLNATGVSATGAGPGQLFSYKDNYINSNTTDGTPITQVGLN